MGKEITLGSLFDGIGGFPYAGKLCGIRTLWASEIDRDCMSITSRHFPEVEHLGDIIEVSGYDIPPVDIITFGSPCQDLSIGSPNRAGLSGERSGLFMEAVRIVREMREATNGLYPTFAIWENVPGAFSSQKGEDFRTVLQMLAETAEIKAQDKPCEHISIPKPAKSKWRTAGAIVGDGWSIAWRTLDARMWGVPQRRRRIYLVTDFRGNRAPEILFKPQSVPWRVTQSKKKRKGTSAAFRNSIEAASRAGTTYCIAGNIIGRQHKNGGNGTGCQGETAYILTTTDRHAVAYGFKANAGGKAQGVAYAPETAPTLIKSQTTETLILYDCYHQDGRYSTAIDASQTITSYFGTGGGNTPMVMSSAKSEPNIGRAINHTNPVQLQFGMHLRRLMPIECERLQGFPDNWTAYGKNGKEKKTISDSSRYKALGNSLAIPTAKRVLYAIKKELKDENKKVVSRT